MGYRSRLGRVAKVERDRYLNRSHEDCTEILEQRYPNECPALYRPPFHEQFIELGKYCEFAITPEPFYNGFNLEEAEECEFHILTKDGLKQIIREYHDNVQKNYEEHVAALEGDDPLAKEVALQFLKDRAREWNIEQTDRYLEAPHPFEMMPYYLDTEENKRDGSIARSWQYEYQIFNLTYIYSSFDWENDFLIYSAW